MVKLQWNSQELVLAWSGEVSHNQHSIVLPSDVGVCFHLESGIEVDVSIADPKTMYEAVRVMVEPVTVEDWEMLDLNAGLVEAQMLNQVATVRSNSIVPIWINSSTVIRMNVKETIPAGIVRLVDGTEVIVAPKPRTVAVKSLDAQEPKKTVRPKKALLRIQHYLAGNASTHLICGRETMKRLRWSDGLLVCISSVGSTKPFVDRMNHSLRPASSSETGLGEPAQRSPLKQDVYLRVFGSDSVQADHALIHVNVASQLSAHLCSRLLVQPQPDEKGRSAKQLHRLLLKPVRWSASSSLRIDIPVVSAIVESVNKWIASNARRVHRSGMAQKSTGTFAIPMTNGNLIAVGGQHYAIYCNIISTRTNNEAVQNGRHVSEDTREIFAELNSHMNSDGTQSSSGVQTIVSMVPNLPGMAALQQFDQVREAGARALEARTEGKMRASREAAELASRQEASKELFMIDSDAVFSNDTVEVGTTIDSPWLFPLDFFIPSRALSSSSSSSSSSNNNANTESFTTTATRASSLSRASSASAISASGVGGTQPPSSTTLAPSIPRFAPSPFNGIPSLTSNVLLTNIDDIGGLDDELKEAMDGITSCLGRRLLKKQLGVKSGGMVLLSGQHGCGKSIMLRALGTHFSRLPQLLAYPLFVSCSEFSGMKVGKIIDALNVIFQDAVLSQPSVILLDDLDLVSAAENAESPQAWAAKAHHSQILSVLIKFMDHVIEKEHEIAIVATSQSSSSLHADLLHPFYVLHQLTLHAPNMKSRASILQKIISRKGLLLCGDHGEILDIHGHHASSELSRVALRTDGYLGGDLEQLIDRAVHAASVLMIESQTDGAGEDLSSQALSTSQLHPSTGNAQKSSRSTTDTTITTTITSETTTTTSNETNHHESSSSGSGVLITDDGLSDNPHLGITNNDAFTTPLRSDLTMRPAISVPLMLEAQEGFVPSSLRGVALNVSSNTSWEDVGGLESVKLNLRETIEWPTRYGFLFKNSPIRHRSGILLFGPSGCGKTLMANAIAKECGLNFISVKGPELLNKYIGQSEQSVRDVFSRAQSASPCVLFFDEFDSIAPRRGHDNTGVTDRVVNQFLTELDGVEGLEGVYVLAATSRPDLIDPALLRPGRLDKSYYIGYPDASEREMILRSLSRKMNLSDDIQLSQIATWAENCTGADLQALLYNSQLLAIHERLDQVKERRNAEAASLPNPSSDRLLLVLRYSDFRAGPDSSPSSSSISDGAAGTVSVLPSQGAMSVASRDVILKKLDSIQHSLIEDRQQQQSAASQSRESQGEVIITMAHIKKAFAQLTPSSSPSEKRRNEQVYANFLSSRGTDFADVTSALTTQKATLA